MLSCQYDPTHWKREDWISAAIVFGVLLLWPLINGYPFIYYDSIDYASGHFRAPYRSPVLGCFMVPIIFVAGHWGYVIIQSSVTAMSFVFLSKYVLGRSDIRVLIISTALSCAGLFSGWLMADIWTLIGLIALFAVLTGYASPFTISLLIFSLATHYGNFPLFGGCAIVFWFFSKVTARSVSVVALCVLCSIGMIITLNFGMTGKVKFGSPRTFSFMGSRILFDIPEILEKKCQDDPTFRLCSVKSEIFAERGTQHSELMFAVGRRIDISEKEFEDSCKELVIYSIPHFAFRHTIAALRNTIKQIEFFSLKDDFLPLSEDSYTLRTLRKSDESVFRRYQDSCQSKTCLSRFLGKVQIPLNVVYWMSMLICLAFLAIGWKNRRFDICYQWILFSITCVVVNALLMSNLSGVLARFHSRIVFLPIFASIVVVYRFIKSNGKFYQKEVVR